MAFGFDMCKKVICSFVKEHFRLNSYSHRLLLRNAKSMIVFSCFFFLLLLLLLFFFLEGGEGRWFRFSLL